MCGAVLRSRKTFRARRKAKTPHPPFRLPEKEAAALITVYLSPPGNKGGGSMKSGEQRESLGRDVLLLFTANSSMLLLAVREVRSHHSKTLI